VSSAADESEWTVGWRIVLACAVANGTGIALLFYTFSMFLIPMTADLGIARSDAGLIQSLIVTAVLGAPVIGRLTDLFGFRRVYVTCSLILAGVGLAQAFWVSGFWSLAVTILVAGFIGGGSSSVVLTQPVNAHFHKFRGRALGLVGIGVSLTTILVPPLLQIVIAENWRWGFLMLAGLSGLIGLPAVLLLMPRQIGNRPARTLRTGLPQDWSFLRVRDFWLLALANMIAGIATGGAISQLAPMIAERGLSAATAAWGVSAFAAGQFCGKLGGGYLLDRFEPRRMAVLMTLIPSLGFVVFLQADPGMAALLLAACTMIGALSGADIDIYAYFVARRFGLASYGSVFGALHGLGWIGAVAGITLFSRTFTETGSYAFAQYAALALLLTAAMLLVPVKLPLLESKNLPDPVITDAEHPQFP
jgi:predicted MFS family arabinose efflux permease